VRPVHGFQQLPAYSFIRSLVKACASLRRYLAEPSAATAPCVQLVQFVQTSLLQLLSVGCTRANDVRSEVMVAVFGIRLAPKVD
jgi:hypothetical protein